MRKGKSKKDNSQSYSEWYAKHPQASHFDHSTYTDWQGQDGKSQYPENDHSYYSARPSKRPGKQHPQSEYKEKSHGYVQKQTPQDAANKTIDSSVAQKEKRFQDRPPTATEPQKAQDVLVRQSINESKLQTTVFKNLYSFGGTEKNSSLVIQPAFNIFRRHSTPQLVEPALISSNQIFQEVGEPQKMKAALQSIPKEESSNQEKKTDSTEIKKLRDLDPGLESLRKWAGANLKAIQSEETIGLFNKLVKTPWKLAEEFVHLFTDEKERKKWLSYLFLVLCSDQNFGAAAGVFARGGALMGLEEPELGAVSIPLSKEHIACLTTSIVAEANPLLDASKSRLIVPTESLLGLPGHELICGLESFGLNQESVIFVKDD